MSWIEPGYITHPCSVYTWHFFFFMYRNSMRILFSMHLSLTWTFTYMFSLASSAKWSCFRTGFSLLGYILIVKYSFILSILNWFFSSIVLQNKLHQDLQPLWGLLKGHENYMFIVYLPPRSVCDLISSFIFICYLGLL